MRLVPILVILLGAPALGGCADSGGGTDEQVDVEGTSKPAEMLASLEERSPVVDRTVLARFRFLLDELQRRCSDSRTELADMAAFVLEQLDERKGVERSLRQIMEAVIRSVDPGPPKIPCEVIFLGR